MTTKDLVIGQQPQSLRRCGNGKAKPARNRVVTCDFGKVAWRPGETGK